MRVPEHKHDVHVAAVLCDACGWWVRVVRGACGCEGAAGVQLCRGQEGGG